MAGLVLWAQPSALPCDPLCWRSGVHMFLQTETALPKVVTRRFVARPVPGTETSLLDLPLGSGMRRQQAMPCGQRRKTVHRR